MIPVLSIFSPAIDWAGGGVLLFLVGWLAKKYILPFLDSEIKKKTAEWLLIIADDLTDYFRARFPESKLWSLLDGIVDKLMKVTGVSRETAERIVTATLKRREEADSFSTGKGK